MIRKIFQVVLYLAAGVYAVLGIRKMAILVMNPGVEDGVIFVTGFLLLAVAAVAAWVTFIARKLPGLLVLPALFLAGPAAIYFVILGPMQRADEDRVRQIREAPSGKWDFGDQPALFAVAQAIVRNDQEGIRTAAKNVPDLNAAGRDGTTLLYFAVGKTWQQDSWVEAVKTLLSLGANPNYNNGQESSFALAHAAEGSALVLRAMLDGGGDPNGRDKDGVPIIFSNWDVSYYTDTQSGSRFDLLLERGADINSTMPETGPCCDGYSLLLYRTSMGVERSSGSATWPAEERAYADALHLLELGADPLRQGSNGRTLAEMLMEHRKKFAQENKAPPQDFERLWEWAQNHNLFSPPPG